jgi:hypothetical protein
MPLTPEKTQVGGAHHALVPSKQYPLITQSASVSPRHRRLRSARSPLDAPPQKRQKPGQVKSQRLLPVEELRPVGFSPSSLDRSNSLPAEQPGPFTRPAAESQGYLRKQGSSMNAASCKVNQAVIRTNLLPMEQDVPSAKIALAFLERPQNQAIFTKHG